MLLLEVGLGGRFDATNVIDQPLAAVVTPIATDHANISATRLEQIAGEKAGIFKRGCPAVIAPQDYPTRRCACSSAAPSARRPADPRRRAGFLRA